MSAFSELLKASFPQDWSNREVARRAEELGVKLSRATVDKYTQETHGRPSEATIRAFHEVLGIPLTKLRQAAKVRIGEPNPWTPPPEADRMTERQRRAIDELIRAMVADSDLPAADRSNDQLWDQQEAIMAESARLGVNDVVFDAAAWARENGVSWGDFNDRFVQLLRRGEVSTVDAVTAAMADLVPAKDTRRASASSGASLDNERDVDEANSISPVDFAWPPARNLVDKIHSRLHGRLTEVAQMEYEHSLAEIRPIFGTPGGVEEYMASAVVAAGDSGFESEVFAIILKEAPPELEVAARQLREEYSSPEDPDQEAGSRPDRRRHA